MTATRPPVLRPFAKPPQAAAQGASAAQGAPAAPRAFRPFAPMARPGAPPAPPGPPAAPPAPPPPPDPLALPGFRRLDDGSDKPLRVSAEVWDSVFPADRQQVRHLAGKYYLFGDSADDAVRKAAAEVERQGWRTGHLAEAVAVLRPLFPCGDRPGRLPAHTVAAAALAVRPTARRHWREILSNTAIGPEKAAFAYRTWHAQPGRCLVCGGAAGGDEKQFGGDAIHRECLKSMPAIGPAFGALVVAEARRIAAAPPSWTEPEPDPSVDPDDPSTWYPPEEGGEGAPPRPEEERAAG